MEIKSALVKLDGEPKGDNCAAMGVSVFQVFASTSALVGLSRSSDYGAVNGNLNALIAWRRTFGCNGQSNLWGMVAGTGLAGSGTGAAGKSGGAAHETAEVPWQQPKEKETSKEQPDDEFPPEFWMRDLAKIASSVILKESSLPMELTFKPTLAHADSDAFSVIKGMQLSTRTQEKDDKILLLCNLPTSTQTNHDGVQFTFKRGRYYVGPKFSNWTHELSRLDNVLMPWLDEPGKARLDLDYTVNYRLKGNMHLSQEHEGRQFAAISFPGGQVTSARSHETLAVQTGQWYDVPGLQQIAYTNEDERVLVICSIKYTALWADETTRGRFTIFRDGQTLDAEGYGLQSVRATQHGIQRTLVMGFVDQPEAGPHVYMVRAAVTAAPEDARVCHLDDDDRQLALIRLPGSSVVGPSRCLEMASIYEDKWTEVPGLSATMIVKQARDKLLIVGQTNFNPAGMEYEAYFTVFRTSASSGSKNLGSESQGLWSVASTATGSSEYPVLMFVDTPGVGTYTYSVYARTRRCGSLTEPQSIDVGPDGQMSIVNLSGAGSSPSLLEMMSSEMNAGRAGYA